MFTTSGIGAETFRNISAGLHKKICNKLCGLICRFSCGVIMKKIQTTIINGIQPHCWLFTSPKVYTSKGFCRIGKKYLLFIQKQATCMSSQSEIDYLCRDPHCSYCMQIKPCLYVVVNGCTVLLGKLWYYQQNYASLAIGKWFSLQTVPAM